MKISEAKLSKKGKPIYTIHSQPVFFGGVKESCGTTSIVENSSESNAQIICSNSLHPETIWDLHAQGKKGFIIGENTPMSHAANALRSISESNAKSLSFVMGVGKFWKIIADAGYCRIDAINNSIILPKLILTFSSTSLSQKPLIGYLIDDGLWRCDKPFNKYHGDLARIIQLGLRKAGDLYFECIVDTKVDKHGRIWVNGYPSPTDIFLKVQDRPQWYLDLVFDYLKQLLKISIYLVNHKCPSYKSADHNELKNMIISHYAFSRPTAAPSDYILRWLEKELSGLSIKIDVEKFINIIVYDIYDFLWNGKSPEPKNLNSIVDSLKHSLKDLFVELMSEKRFYSVIDLKKLETQALLNAWRCFIAGTVVSDLRRLVIRSGYRKCEWMRRLFVHRSL